MRTNLLSSLAITLITSSAFAFVDTDARLDELEHKMSQVRAETAIEGRYGAETASARVEVDGEGWFIIGDILYWQTRVGGTEFAYSDKHSNAILPISGRTKDMEFDWDWGLRVGLGYHFAHDRWDVSAQYTWFETNGSDSSRAGTNSSLVPLKGSSSITNLPGTPRPTFLYCTSAKSQYQFDFDAVDLELGRAYFISGRLSFRPHWGLKTAWINQEQIVRYTGGEPDANMSEAGLQGNTVHIDDNCDFWGMGPRVGFDTKWHIGNGFSIFGNLATALLFGYFDVKHEEDYSAYLSNRIDIHANRHAFSPTVQFMLGLRYDTYVYHQKQHLGIGLGFEAQYWWRQNQMLKIDDSASLQYERYSEDMSLHGLTVDFTWNF